MDVGTEPCHARGNPSQEHCVANPLYNDTAPEAGLLLSSHIETK